MARVVYKNVMMFRTIPFPDSSSITSRTTGAILTSLRVFLLVSIALALLSADALATNTNHLHRPTGLVFPLKVHFFEREEIRDYDLNYPGMGTSIQYRFADINAFIRIYDLGRNGLDIKVDEIKGELKRSVDGVYKKLKDGYYGTVEQIDPPSMFRSNGGRNPVYMAGFTINIGSKSFREYYYVTAYKKHFISIKVIHPGTLSDDIVRNAFANDILAMFHEEGANEISPEPRRSEPGIKRSKKTMPLMEDLELYKKNKYQ